MPKTLLIVTGYHADSEFSVESTHASLIFNTDDIRHGTNTTAVKRIKSIVREYVADMETDGWDFLRIEHSLLSEVFFAISNIEDGDPDGKLSFKHDFVDESAYKTTLWVGPAE